MKALLLILILILNFEGIAQDRVKPINTSLLEKEQIKLVFLTADWCTICQNQKAIINHIDKDSITNILFLELDIESNDSIIMNGQIFSSKPTGVNNAEHELARFLVNNSAPILTPYCVVLNQHNEVIGHYSGLLNESDLRDLFSALLDLR